MNTHFKAVVSQIERSTEAAGRAANPPRLLAVSKKKPAAVIAELAALGQRAFGENYLQEALDKQKELADLALEWHFIGPIQSRKCGQIARHFDWVHSVDRLSIAEKLSRGRANETTDLNVLIQVNIDEQASKSGVLVGDLTEMAEAICQLPKLALRGIMVIPKAHEYEAEQRAVFVRSAAQLAKIKHLGGAVDQLSMGMSNDLHAAVLEGATWVRVGTALFGARP